MRTRWVHHYVSTACAHAEGENRPELHAACRNQCKHAHGQPEYCGCSCHSEAGTQPHTGSPVDQARDLAMQLLAVIRVAGIDLTAVAPELAGRLNGDPALFWVRGEAQPPGRWAGPTNPNHPDRPWIVIDPAQNFGHPSLGRSRVKVENILERLDAGEDWEGVADDHGLTRADLLVACWFDARYGVGVDPRADWLDWWEDWEQPFWRAKTAQDYDNIPFPPFRRTP